MFGNSRIASSKNWPGFLYEDMGGKVNSDYSLCEFSWYRWIIVSPREA